MMPSNHLFVGLLATASTAFILGMLSTSWCQFASVSFSVTFSPPETDDDVLRMDISPTNSMKLYLGLWRHQSFGIKSGAFHVPSTCEEYSSQTQITVDGNWMAARVFGILALVIGGVHILIISWLSFSKKPLSRTSLHMKATPWVHLLCCLLQALTLVMLKTEFCNQSLKQGVETLLDIAIVEWSDKCELESGSKMAIVSMVFWFVSFILALFANCFASKSLSTSASANNGREKEQNPNDECQRNVKPRQYSVAVVSKADQLDEEAVVSPPEVVPKVSDSVASKSATTLTPRETSTPKQSSPKTSLSKQTKESLTISPNNSDNESRVSSIVTRNVSVSSTGVASAKGSPGRRKAKYR